VLRIHIDSCRSDVFIILLEYIYTGIVDIGPKEAFDLLKVADEYKLIHLKSKCENIISQSVNEDNVVHLFKLAWHSKAKYLKDYCLSVILENHQRLGPTIKQELSSDMLKEVKKALSAAYVPRIAPAATSSSGSTISSTSGSSISSSPFSTSSGGLSNLMGSSQP
jgi:hypothetical protein